jgi:hypothetical protein
MPRRLSACCDPDDFWRDGLKQTSWIKHRTLNDPHPGAQFNSEFRSLVKIEEAKLAADKKPPAENRLAAEAQCDSCAALF